MVILDMIQALILDVENGDWVMLLFRIAQIVAVLALVWLGARLLERNAVLKRAINALEDETKLLGPRKRRIVAEIANRSTGTVHATREEMKEKDKAKRWKDA
ncbi:unnamed protein product [marine sediment metagenome]|uniref:Uncharacterized protein n=1 Tax=marine sediment metagenome TaxID=412755 RepID=X0SFR0_9ZZZZ